MKRVVLGIIILSFLFTACSSAPDVEINLPKTNFETFDCVFDDTECMEKINQYRLTCKNSIITLHTELASEEYRIEKKDTTCEVTKKSLQSAYADVTGTDMFCEIPMSQTSILNGDEIDYFRYCDGPYKDRMQDILVQFSPIVAGR